VQNRNTRAFPKARLIQGFSFFRQFFTRSLVLLRPAGILAACVSAWLCLPWFSPRRSTRSRPTARSCACDRATAAESFDRISEYFGGGENSARRIVLRSRSGDRAGYYFLVRLVNTAPARAGPPWCNPFPRNRWKGRTSRPP
jgi:hypothetical protein